MPPQRWIERVEPERETLGQLLSRLREERGWTQDEAADRASMAQALLSKYELDKVATPDDRILENLEGIYGLPEATLALAALRTQRRKRARKKPLPGVSLAVPDEPGMEDVLREVILLEPEWLPDVAVIIGQFREDAERRAQESKD